MTTYPDSLSLSSSSSASSLFDPNVHLAYQSPAERLTMGEMGLSHVGAPSTIGVTSPFPLASLEGVKAMRAALLQPHVLDAHMMQSALAGPHAQLRGMATDDVARFVRDFWMHPATLAAVSEAAGEDLVPIMDLELGHTNIQIPSGMDRRTYINTLSEDPFAAKVNSTTTATATSTTDKAPSAVVGYHRDAYPWVCVLMLSDVSAMRGGETEIRRGDGTYIRAIGPGIGHCVMMQGGYIEHCALPSHGAAERITMVTSFRPRRKLYTDVTDLRNIRDCSNLHELHDQFTRSRLDVVQEAIDMYRARLHGRRRAVEAQFGRRGGLRQPTVGRDEWRDLIEVITGTLGNSLVQMPDLTQTPLQVTSHDSKL